MERTQKSPNFNGTFIHVESLQINGEKKNLSVNDAGTIHDPNRKTDKKQSNRMGFLSMPINKIRLELRT